MPSNDYIASTSVNVFPSSLRSGNFSQGKFTTEYNLTSFLRAVTDKKSFAIADPNVQDHSSPHYNEFYYQFVLNGFYFEVLASSLSRYSWEHLYASIQVDSIGRLIDWNGGTALDSGTNCIAIKFTEAEPTATEAGISVYSLDLKSATRFAKFTTDTFYINNSDLSTILNGKQDKFTSINKFDLEGGLVVNELPEVNGGTGSTSLASVNVGGARKIVNGSGVPVQIGGANAVFINADGVPAEVQVVTSSSQLAELVGGQVRTLTVGDATHPIYFSNGKPALIGNVIDSYAAGVQNGCGQYDTSNPDDIKCTMVYFNKPAGASGATATAGITIHTSSKTPEGTTGNVGDLWFKYSNE